MASDLNADRDAMQSTHKGASAPSYLKSGMFWLDDAANPLWILKIYDGTHWIKLFEIDINNNNSILNAVKNGTARTHGASIAQIQDGEFVHIGASTGTNTLTATATPTVTAYPAGAMFIFTAGGTNTGAVTLNVDGAAEWDVQKKGAALVADDITINNIVVVVSNGTNFQMVSPSKLGTASLLDTGTGAGELPTNADIVFPSAIPAGGVIEFGGTSAPSGWLLCYGQEVSRSTFSVLFAAVGITHGSGDGSTTFNVPDHRGRVTAGKDNMGGASADRLTGTSGGVNGDNLGATGGDETHGLVEAENGPHKHVLNGRIGSLQFGSTGIQGSNTPGSTIAATGIGSSGSGTPHLNVQPTIIMTKIIKT